jgi:hypothetical protein
MIKNHSLGGRFVVGIASFVSSSSRRCFAGLMAASLAAVIFSSLTPAVSHATVINYPDMSGTSVDFTAISENTHEPGPLPLFGAPVVSGDALDFTPINFASSALVGPGFDFHDGFLTFMATSKTGQSIQNIKFAEGGALSVVGTGTDQTFVSVSAVGFVKVIQIDDAPLPANTAIPLLPITLTFSFGNLGDGSWGRASDGFANGKLWTGSQLINITQELTNLGIPFVKGATKITVALDNALYAQAEETGGAYIDKKDFFTVTTNVPEPASCMLFAFGLVAGLIVSRRSR